MPWGVVCLKRRTVVSALVFVFFLFLTPVVPAAASPEQDRALEILDSRTSSHWGEDNLAWVVHYPEELVEPWVKAESSRRKMNAEQAARYRKAFTDELKIGAATAVMFSVHSFGTNPLKLAPIAKNVVLLDSSGKRVAPMVYEKKLDSPISGLAQGFIFFPKQKDDNFRIAIKGLVPDKETIFAFGGSSGGAIIATTPAGTGSSTKKTGGNSGQPKDVVVKIPTTKPPVSPVQPKPPVASVDPKKAEPEFSIEGETYVPTTPPAEPVSREAPPATVPVSAPPQPETKTPRQAPLVPPKQVLDIFLKAWIKGDTDRMYEQLSADSQSRISKDLFEKDVLSAGAFRQGLREGYKVSWDGNSAKVTVSQKMLLMRTLSSKRIDFVEENGAARIAW